MALACGQAVFAQVAAERGDLDVLVVIPLEDSEALSTTAPSVTELIGVRWAYGPGVQVPGIYIVPPAILGNFERVEEYRLALHDAAIPQDFVACHRCWRTHEAAERGWEFNRAIYFRSRGGQRN